MISKEKKECSEYIDHLYKSAFIDASILKKPKPDNTFFDKFELTKIQ